TFWMWESKPTGGTGKEFTFNPSNKDEHGVYFEVNLGVEYPSATEVGIIIKKGAGWSGEREPGGDRFINLSDIEVKNGKAHAYFVQGSVKFATSDADLENGVVEYGATILYNGFARRNNKFYIDVN